jgi:hypothetical protein
MTTSGASAPRSSVVSGQAGPEAVDPHAVGSRDGKDWNKTLWASQYPYKAMIDTSCNAGVSFICDTIPWRSQIPFPSQQISMLNPWRLDFVKDIESIRFRFISLMTWWVPSTWAAFWNLLQTPSMTGRCGKSLIVMTVYGMADSTLCRISSCFSKSGQCGFPLHAEYVACWQTLPVPRGYVQIQMQYNSTIIGFSAFIVSNGFVSCRLSTNENRYYAMRTLHWQHLWASFRRLGQGVYRTYKSGLLDKHDISYKV